MSGNMYTWLLERYRGRLSDWTTEAELSSQLKLAYLQEAPNLLRATGQLKAPFDPVEGLRYRGVHDFRLIEKLREEARLIPDMRGFTLWLRHVEGFGEQAIEARQFETRLRTTLAHELGHTFFYDVSTFPPRSQSSYLSMSGLHAADEKEEWWCMDFARAYLMPDFWVAENVKETSSPSLEAALQVRRRLNVSWDILFRRLVWDLKVWRNCVIFRVDIKKLQTTGLWKSKQLGKWSFRKWFQTQGKAHIVSATTRPTHTEELVIRPPLTAKDEVELHLLMISGSPYVLGAILPATENPVVVSQS